MARRLIVLASWVALAAGARRTANLVFEYHFTREDCVEKSFADSVGGPLDTLARNATTTRCLSGVGVRGGAASLEPGSPRVTSQGGLSALKSALPASGALTLEAWIRPASVDSDDEQLIFALGSSEPGVDDCYHTYDLRLVALGERLRLYWSATDQYGDQQCESHTVQDLELRASQIHHVALAQQGGTISFYLDGALVDTEDDAYISPRNWRDAFEAQLFADGVSRYVPSPSWDGDVLLVAMYAASLSAGQIASNFQAKLPDSLPVVRDMDVRLAEDGETSSPEGGAFYDSPRMYETPFPLWALERVRLDAADIDARVGYVNYDASNPAMEVFVSSLSPLCAVWACAREGCALADEAVALNATNRQVWRDEAGNFSVFIVPPKDAYSGDRGLGGSDRDGPLCNFSYYALDGVTRAASANVARAYVNVHKVNDPPRPANISVYSLARVSTPIRLTGIDVDDTPPEWGDGASAAFIARLPLRGDLHRVFPNGTISPSPLSFANHTGGGRYSEGARFLSLRSLDVAYVYTGNCTIPSGSESTLIFEDSFGFAVRDRHGAISTVGNVSVRVKPAIFALAPSDAERTAYEEEETPIALYAHDSADKPRSLCTKLTRVPSRGTLVERVGTGGANGSFVEHVVRADEWLHTTFEPPYTAPIELWFTGERDYFNTPAVTWNGTELGAGVIGGAGITFFVAPCNERKVNSVSRDVEIVVVNVADAPTLDNSSWGRIASNHGAVYGLGFVADDHYGDDAWGNNCDGDDDGPCGVAAYLAGLELIDPDRDVDAVRATVDPFLLPPSQFPTRVVTHFALSRRRPQVRVDVSTGKNGRLSLNRANLKAADFNSCEFCLGGCTAVETNDDANGGGGAQSWVCAGDGDTDSSMTFIAQPSDVTRLLSALRYVNVRSNVRDRVRVVVYDGYEPSGGRGCLMHFASLSRRDECAVVNAEFEIEIQDYADSFVYLGGGTMPNQVKASITLLALVICLTCCVCCNRIARRCIIKYKTGHDPGAKGGGCTPCCYCCDCCCLEGDCCAPRPPQYEKPESAPDAHDEDDQLLDHDQVRFKVRKATKRDKHNTQIAVKVREDDPESDPANWEMFEAPAKEEGRRGRPYWHNSVTGTTTWEEPEFHDATGMARRHSMRIHGENPMHAQRG